MGFVMKEYRIGGYERAHVHSHPPIRGSATAIPIDPKKGSKLRA